MRDFLELFLSKTSKNLFVCSLANAGSDDLPRERHVDTRDIDHIVEFCKKWDKPGRGVFFCVGTVPEGKPRKKENISELPALYVDIDLKDTVEDRDAVVDKLWKLELFPTFIISSGNGIHAYWFLQDAILGLDSAEDLLRSIARKLGGDPLVAHRAALMRMPETHNTKEGSWKDVEVLSDGGPIYTRSQLEVWLSDQSVLIGKKNKLVELTDNPFLRTAELYSFTPPVDVDRRLSSMQFQGEGDSGIHATQLSVTASLLSSGNDLEEVVTRVLEATKRVAPSTWDWSREERDIRKMCVDWMRKQEKKVVNGDNVVQLSDKRSDKKDTRVKKNELHVVVGNGVLAKIREEGGDILTTGEEVWRCQDGLWKLLSPGEIRGWLDREAEIGFVNLDVISTQKMISETRSWILRHPEIHVEEVDWDNHGCIATLSGLLDVQNFTLRGYTSKDFVTRQVRSEYEPGSDCPWWKSMLDDVFPKDTGAHSFLQELLGVALLDKKPKSLMRALVLVGPSNSGKSNILSTMVGLLSSNPNMTTFDMLENSHGLMDFLRKDPWLLHEAFDQSKWHFSSTVKALLSGDPVSINVKNGPILTHQFNSPVFWGTNSPPQFKEASRAIENRLKIMKCHVVFDPDRLTGVALEARKRGYSNPSDFVLSEERSGILNWALEGMKRAIERGYFVDTAEMAEATTELRMNSNIVAGFFADSIEYSPNYMVSKPDLYATYVVWWRENRGEERGCPSVDAMSRAISSLYDSRIGVDNHYLRHNNVRYIAGIKLNDAGLDMWTAYFNSAAVRGDSSRISSSPEDVNKEILDKWEDLEVIKKIREEYNS